MLPAHGKDVQNLPIVPIKSDAVSKDQVKGNGESDFKAPDAKVVSKKSKSSSKKTFGPENKPTEQEKVESDPKKDQEESSDHKKSKEIGEVKKGKETDELKKGKETDEAEKSKIVNVKETKDFIAESEVELGIEVGYYLYYFRVYAPILLLM